jgi:hypothetical protein
MGSMTRIRGDELKPEYTVFVLEKQYTKSHYVACKLLEGHET